MQDSVQNLPQVRALGRHSYTDGTLTLFYTGSGIECICTGSELWLDLNADYELNEPWLSVELNGAWISRFPVTTGHSEVCIYRGMSSGTPKHVRVFNDVQAMYDDPRHLLQITALRWENGEFLPLPDPKYRLEFVGDSITSGEGALGAPQEEDWISAFFSVMNHYGRMTADALDAEFRFISQSGWGILSGWENDPHRCVMSYYESICGVARGERNAALGAQTPYDFRSWPADAVIVNLGTNDAGASHNPAWVDPESGISYAQSTTPEHREKLKKAVIQDLKQLRRCNPNALLVWAYGMLGDELRATLEDAVANYRHDTGDERAYFLLLPDTTPETVGARQHPGAAAHRKAADTLTAFLREKL